LGIVNTARVAWRMRKQQGTCTNILPHRQSTHPPDQPCSLVPLTGICPGESPIATQAGQLLNKLQAAAAWRQLRRRDETRCHGQRPGCVYVILQPYGCNGAAVALPAAFTKRSGQGTRECHASGYRPVCDNVARLLCRCMLQASIQARLACMMPAPENT
jgi:hypothetical protein